MSATTHNRGGRRVLAGVWTCALVLATLVVVSLSSVGAQAATYASRDPEVLFLDAATGNELTTTMDLFKNAYVNASGQTVVASADGTKLVAPGTQGSYEFVVRNSGGQPAAYRVWAETAQAGTTQAIPLTVSLASGASTCADLADAGDLAPGKSAVYRIDWSWPFEQGATSELRQATDERDTALGNESVNRRATYTVTLHMQAEADYPERSDRAPQTGDTSVPAVAVEAILALGVLLVLLGMAVRRRNREGSR